MGLAVSLPLPCLLLACALFDAKCTCHCGLPLASLPFTTPAVAVCCSPVAVAQVSKFLDHTFAHVVIGLRLFNSLLEELCTLVPGALNCLLSSPFLEETWGKERGRWLCVSFGRDWNDLRAMH